MADPRRPAWPTRARLSLYLRLLAGLTLLFAVVYGGCNWLAHWRGGGLALYADWELRLPFVPAMIYVYLSIGALFMLPAFCLDEHEMRALARAFAMATLAAGACFLLLPAHLGHERPAVVEGHATAFAVLYQLDLAHNLVPSLHITYCTLILRVVSAAWPLRAVVVAAYGWLALMAAAVVLVRQHHLLDVAAGLALGWLSHRLYQARLRGALP